MARVTVRLPGLLASILGGDRSFEIEAISLAAALDEIVRRRPALGVHLFDETGRIRQHVLVFHNDTNTRWLDDLGVPLSSGDEITILQAVSGGSTRRRRLAVTNSQAMASVAGTMRTIERTTR